MELEIAQKSKIRYRDKVNFYVSLMRSEVGRTTKLKQVRFVCLKKPCFEALSKETRIFGSLFRVEYSVQEVNDGVA
ncbi:MAG: hypothetical protein EOP05_00430 [Proteobacteria bacterium]|nr:MAG: hypothetical protein EOP05_00430 [Pseudomonadota bacterium]